MNNSGACDTISACVFSTWHSCKATFAGVRGMCMSQVDRVVDAAGALRLWRTERNLTQREVADALGVPSQAISDWEVGRKDPSARAMFAIEDLTEIPARSWVPEHEIRRVA